MGIVGNVLRDDRDSGRKVVRCPRCGHIQVSPLPSPEQEAAYYANDMQPRSLFGDRAYYDILKAKAKMDTDRRLDWVRAVRGPAARPRLLDVGAGYGFFVDAAVQAGYDANGLEYSPERFELCRTRMAGTFLNGEVDDAFLATHAGKYDLVTSFHVIEHLRDPISYLSRILRLIAPGGALMIEVPNVDDELNKQIPEYADHQWQICHLSYFDRPRLDIALRQAGAVDFTIAGVQRYGLRHLIRWTDHRAPDLNPPEVEGTSPLTERAEAAYRADRERALTCDTLIATIRVPATCP